MPKRIILTHENADFDAMASMLAMHKLDPSAIPVLPHRVNRNVENFMTLYAKSLMPAKSHRELTRQHIEQVYIVDTQSFNNVKGVKEKTPKLYIDHHPLTLELTAYEIYEGEPTGANVTLLIERIIADKINLSPQEATFLMLGIYEDTGTLSYGSTTVRDIKAAAWLLEQGADLDIMRKFLSYPLNEELHAVYDQLLHSLTIREVAGHSILLATAVVEKEVQQLAGLTQKLRDLYDPSALVLLVQLSSDTQFIGRSSVSAIDIGKLAERFGGGGHSRASAAILNDMTASEAFDAVNDYLERVVQPVVRVRELMSAAPIFTFEHDTSVQAAIEASKHVTHEGFPVLRDGKVVGLLTRQALDRAFNHNLKNRPVTDIMEVGKITVKADDSLEYLRQQMIDSGWGQMPVVDDKHHLAGIVTRTDLIRLWNESLTRPQSGGMLHSKLQHALPDSLWVLVNAISQAAQDKDIGLYLVGGFVRDLVLDTPNLDIDFVVEGNAIDFVEILQEKFGGDTREHAQFNTAKWRVDQGVAKAFGFDAMPPEWSDYVDFATARTEFYDQPTILPTVRQSSIKLDLHRRDFTINALSIRLSPEPAGELLDFYNGEKDLQEGWIRVLHSLSFVDDPTRMMRAVRFEQRLGFEIEPRTLELFEAALPLIQRVSGDRLRNEFNLMMAEHYPLRNFRRLDTLHILETLHPSLKVDDWFEAACYALINFRNDPRWQLPEDFDAWRSSMFGLLTVRMDKDSLAQLGETLSIGNSTLRHFEAVIDLYHVWRDIDRQMMPSQLDALLGGFGHIEWIMLWATSRFAYQRYQLEKYVGQWRHVRSNYDGNRLIEHGLSSGPAIGKILRALHHAWLDGDITTRHEEDAMVQQLIEQYGA